MESTVNRRTVLRVGFSVILSISYFTLGCSSDNSPAAKADAGKKDGGKGGSGGSSSNGGSSGAGGSSASGGTSGSGGSSASGGTSGSGGSGGSGGSSASGGSGGTLTAAGGSGGSGGSSGSGGKGGTGGADAGSTQRDSGGSVDGEASDALDAPLPGDDGASSEAGASLDGGAPVLLDTAAQDSESLDSVAIDTPAAIIDAEVDTTVVDATAQDLASSEDAGTCLQQIINNGFAFPTAAACSQCRDNTQNPPTDIHSQCEAMTTCLNAASCQDSSNNCWSTCQNTLTGNQPAAASCAAALVTAACH